MRDDLISRAFGINLRDARKRKGVTQEQLAKRARLKRTSITNIEKGRQSLSLPALYALATALDVEVHELLPSRSRLDVLRTAEAKVARAAPEHRADIAHWVDAVTSE